MNRAKTIGLVLGVGVLAVGGGVWGAIEWNRARLVARFQPHVTEYMGMQPAVLTQPKGDPYAKGRIAPIDVTKLQLDRDVYFALPSELQADTPEDVGTVVLLRWQELEIDAYSNGGKALRHDCWLTVIDRGTKAVVADGVHFKGGEPPERIKQSAQSGTGPKPVDQVVEYLKKLPRR